MTPSIRAHAPSHGALRVALALLGFALGLLLVAALARGVPPDWFASRDERGIFGWCAANGYPKQRDLFLFAAAFLLAPGLAVALPRWLARGDAPRSDAPEEDGAVDLPSWRCTIALAGGLGLALGLVALAAWPAEPKSPLDSAVIVGGVAGAAALLLLSLAWLVRARPLGAALERRGRPLTLLVVAPALLIAWAWGPEAASRGGLDLYHDGESLAPLAEMERGAVPCRDFYVPHGIVEDALLPRWGALAWGTTIESARTLRAVAVAAGALALWAVASQAIASPPLAFACVLLAFWRDGRFLARFLPAFVSLALLLAWWRADPQRRVARATRLLLAGVAAGGALGWSLDAGLYAVAIGGAALLLVAVDRRRFAPLAAQLPLFAAGVALGLAPLAAWLERHDALGAAWRNGVEQAGQQLATWGRACPPLAATWAAARARGVAALVDDEAGLFWIALALALVAAAWLATRVAAGTLGARRHPAGGALLAVAAVVFLRTPLGRFDGAHLATATAPLWLLAGVAIDALLASRRPTRWLVAAALVGSVAALAARSELPAELGSRLGALTARARHAPASAEPLPRSGRLALPDAKLAPVRELLAGIAAELPAGAPLLDLSNQGALYFLADRRSVTRFLQLAHAPSSAQQQELIAAAERAHVEWALFSDAEIDGIANSRRHPLVAEWLERTFEPVKSFGATTLLRRR